MTKNLKFITEKKRFMFLVYKINRKMEITFFTHYSIKYQL